MHRCVTLVLLLLSACARPEADQPAAALRALEAKVDALKATVDAQDLRLKHLETEARLDDTFEETHEGGLFSLARRGGFQPLGLSGLSINVSDVVRELDGVRVTGVLLNELAVGRGSVSFEIGVDGSSGVAMINTIRPGSAAKFSVFIANVTAASASGPARFAVLSSSTNYNP